jgi:hypothetical protein
MAQGTTKGVPIDIDPLLAADSDLLVPSQKAVKSYAQPQLNGVGFVKASGTTISYDNSTYLTSIGTGTTNELTYWSGTNSIGSLTTATYPSLTELSYVKGATSSLQTQISAKQDLALSAYSFRANNTNATANAADATYRDAGLQTYVGTATWTGTTAPSGSTTHSYYWNRVGNLVTLRINLAYTVAGSALTLVSMTLPADCPTPASPSGVTAANEVLSYGSGALATAKTMISFATVGATISALRRNSANNGYDIVVTRPSAAYQYAYATIQYFA